MAELKWVGARRERKEAQGRCPSSGAFILSKCSSWQCCLSSLKRSTAVHPKGDQSWVFIGRTDVEAETPILWPSDAKSWLIGKDPDAGKDWGQVEKETAEDEMIGWHHRLNGHGFGRTLGVGDRQGGLACCGSWGRKELDTTERLNWTELNHTHPHSFLASS